MKVRQGFVSNSSSSSFLLYGTVVKAPDGDVDPYDFMSTLEETGLRAYKPYSYDDDISVGLSWSSVGDNETGAQFKARVEALINSVLPGEHRFGTMKEAWYNG